MNAKGTTNATYQIGKRGGKIFGGVSTPTVADVSTGDVWLDKTNLKTKIALLVVHQGLTLTPKGLLVIRHCPL